MPLRNYIWNMDFSGRFLMNFIHFADQQGANTEKLIGLTGETIDTLCAEDYRVPSAKYNAVLEQAVQDSKDAFLGLHAGEAMSITASGLIGQITQTSGTVKEALEYCCEFASLGCKALPMQLEEQANTYQLKIVPDPLWLTQSEESVKQTLEGVLAFTIQEFHALIRNKHYPIRLDYQFAVSDELKRVMNCEIQEGKPVTALYFKKEHIEEEVITSNYDLLRVLVKHAEEKIRKIEKKAGFSSKVKQAVIMMVKPDFPTLKEVASNLNMSVRTFQRKLGEEGKTFKEIVEELKQEFAIDYLKQDELTIGEIAYLLSYADVSAFIRSFKRWTGKTPGDYRREL